MLSLDTKIDAKDAARKRKDITKKKYKKKTTTKSDRERLTRNKPSRVMDVEEEEDDEEVDEEGVEQLGVEFTNEVRRLVDLCRANPEEARLIYEDIYARLSQLYVNTKLYERYTEISRMKLEYPLRIDKRETKTMKLVRLMENEIVSASTLQGTSKLVRRRAYNETVNSLDNAIAAYQKSVEKLLLLDEESGRLNEKYEALVSRNPSIVDLANEDYETYRDKRVWLKGYIKHFVDRFALITTSQYIYLTDLQRGCLYDLDEKARRLSLRVTDEAVLARTKVLKGRQVVAHLPLFEVLRSMNESKDDRIFSLFKTGKSMGENSLLLRGEWEDRIFKDAYQRATPEERVKYGVISIENDEEGAEGCGNIYGRSYIVYKEDVKSRMTVGADDSSSEKIKDLGTFSHLNHIIEDFTLYETTLSYNVYLEVQIHGDVKLSRDIEIVKVDNSFERSTAFMEQLRLYKENFGTIPPFQFIGDDEPIDV